MIEIEVPGDVQVEIKGSEVFTKGALGTNTRKFNDALLSLAKEQNKITITTTKEKVLAKKAAMAERSLAKELKNDMEGVKKHFELSMTVVFAHFPITVEVKANTLNIKNIIGERYPRSAQIIGTTKVEVKGNSVRVYGTSKDDVSQTAANIRRACKMRNKDIRVFQDGVYFAIE